MKAKAFATKLPSDLIQKLDEACKKLGIRKNFLVEEALSEKLEDIFDAYDLREAVGEATGFHSWRSIRPSHRGKG